MIYLMENGVLIIDPFNLSETRFFFSKGGSENEGEYQDKALAVWNLKD